MRMNCCQPLPYYQGRGIFIVLRELVDYIKIAVEVGRKHVVQNGAHIRVDAPTARESLGATFRVHINSAAYFRKSLRDLVLTKQEIPVAPGYLGGKRISALRFAESVAGGLPISLRLVGCTEVHPHTGVMRIQSQCRAVITDGALSVRLIQRVLPIAPEEVPVFSIRRFPAHRGLETGGGSETDLMRCPGNADAEIRETSTENKSK